MSPRHRDRDRNAPTRKGTAISVVSPEGGGKTSFGLTMPTPIAYCSVDPNTEAIIEKAIEEGDVAADDLIQHHLRYPAIAFSDQDDVKDEAQTAWDALIDVLRPYVKQDGDPQPKSIVFDTATEVDNLNVLAEFGKLDQISPESRRNRMGPVNSRYKGMIRALTDVGIHVALLHRAGDLWRDVEVRTRHGKEDRREKVEGAFAMERKGFKETGFITSTEIFLAHDPTRHEKLVAQFGMYIARCSIRPGLKGTEHWGREKQSDGTRVRRASFAYLMSQIHPHTSLDDWR